jgi:hypothetical protein
MIGIYYKGLVQDKMRRIVAEIDELPSPEREEYGFSHNYARRVSKGTYDKPSNRILDLLGFDIAVVDRETGEIQVCQLGTKNWKNPPTRAPSSSE